MAKINVLNQEISSKIAAGEVVDRPVSVVKELVENSIDAGSTAITVEIKAGGISFIRVTDNGCGIDEDDVVVAFERHATSKISSEKDLNRIETLGFRGEALASIAAVSQVELITKTKENIIGSIVEINGGLVEKKEEIGCPNGTTIVAKNLFFNTPARLKFLKKESTEAGLVSDLIERLALTHPEISFKLINNGQNVVHTTGNGDVLTTIISVFGRDISKGMIQVALEEEGIKVSGFIGKPEISRSNRNYQCIFINRRFVKNKTITSALEMAYKTLLTINKYPVSVLYIDISPSLIDVNVHPAKMEVRFYDEDIIYNLILNTVSSALKNNVLIPQIILNKHETTPFELKQANMAVEKIQSMFKPEMIKETKEAYSVPAYESRSKKSHDKMPQNESAKIEKPEVVTEQQTGLNELEQLDVKITQNYRIIGQIFSTYIIIEMEDKMFVIDQHAAHERLKYKGLLNKHKDNGGFSQSLISPIVAEVSNSEFKKVEENIDTILDLGLEIEPFGENTYLLRSVPYVLGENYAKEFFYEVVDKLNNVKINNVLDFRQEMLYSMACKAAVKANRILSGSEMQKLVEDVLNMDDAFTCPHGRPIIISISKYELEKMFKRVQ